MFGLKRKPHAQTLVLLDENGREISRCDIRDYALAEDAVIALSIEYFNDPTPCEVHRGAVHKRVIMEIQELSTSGGTVSVSSCNESQKRFFQADVAAFRIE